jgi:hypothetical protein
MTTTNTASKQRGSTRYDHEAESYGIGDAQRNARTEHTHGRRAAEDTTRSYGEKPATTTPHRSNAERQHQDMIAKP